MPALVREIEEKKRAMVDLPLQGELRPGQSTVVLTSTHTADADAAGITAVVTNKFDWMKLPPELGGRKSTIVDRFTAPRCFCRSVPAHSACVYVLEHPYIAVACVSKGFAWMKKPDNLAAFKAGLTKH